MPVALGFIGAALSGALAGFGAAGGMAAAFGTALLGTVLGTVAGVGLYGLNMLLMPGVANTTAPSGVSFTDTGLRFDPTPNFTSSQQVVPLVFGKTTVSPQIAHRRVYSTNYKRGYFFLACGEAPLELDSILVDDVNIRDLQNYTETPGDPNKSWFQWIPLGSTFSLLLNNSGEFNWGVSETKYYPAEYNAPPETYGSITGPIVMIYGGGSIKIKAKFAQDQADAGLWIRFKLENYYSPSEVKVSDQPGKWVTTAITGEHSSASYRNEGWFCIYLDSTIPVKGGHIDTTTIWNGEYTFEGIEEQTTWRPVLEYAIISAPTTYDRAQVTFDSVVVKDTDTTEDFSCWGTAYAVVHLSWHEPLSTNPSFSCVVKGFGREYYHDQDEGNPALCAYFLLTDRDNHESDPYDILHDRVEPGQIDWESVQETAGFCNSLMNGEGYRFNRAVGAPMEKEAVLKEITAAGRFFIFVSGAKIIFKPDRDEPITRVISEAMEIVPGSMKVARVSANEVNSLRASYYDAGLGYTVQTIQVDLDQEGFSQASIDLTGVTDQHQAFELARYSLLGRKAKYILTCQVRLHTVLTCWLGDLVEIDTDHPLISGKTWRIMAIPEESPGHIYTLQLVEHDPSIYTSIIDGQAEAGYVAYTPWYHIPIDSKSSPFNWPGGNVGPSQVINLDITSIVYHADPLTTTGITIGYEYLASNAEKIIIEYSIDAGQTWTTAGYSTSNTYSFNVNLRWGLLMVRAAAIYNNETGKFAVAQEHLEGRGGDDAGIGKAQIGWSPIGGS